ncbi:MAG: hydroxymethylbilane synthase [Chloroflexi bacterium]|nr:hydroxymethylbilane synthase [Chloroflexota bacterium]
MHTKTIRVGTRGSALALWQACWVVGQLQNHHPDVSFQVVEISTRGDRVRDVPLFQAGGVGLFVKELEYALRQDEIDLAVHSLKDMPSQVPPELTLAAVPERGDPRDALVSRLKLPLMDLPDGARVGTSSRRRAAQLLALRPDFQIVNLRGNVDTRLRKAESDQYDAVVLAAAGLMRMDQDDRITETLSPEMMLPAGGQGALAVEVRSDDEQTIFLAAPLNHPPTWTTVIAERAFLARLGGGCHVPIAAYAELKGNQLWLRALVGSPDGRTLVQGERRGTASQAEMLGRALAGELLEQGAAELLDALEEELG